MSKRLPATAVLVLLGLTHCSQEPKAERPLSATYVDSHTCAACHSQIASSYARTGMARSFYKPSASRDVTSRPIYHKASETSFTMLAREGVVYQRHWQNGYQGREENAEELRVDYVMGSGNHVRTFLHRTERGTLIELPLAWYAERGGYWGLNPGFDFDHWPARRKVGYDCMFCHNAYPSIPPGHDDSGSEPVFAGALPEGVDCQRCHGPGSAHVAAAQRAGAKVEDVRQAILNPARLPAERRMDVCMQCHLETTSFGLPNAIRRFDRGPFSYRPDEPLSAFILFFDHAPGTGHDEKFEIVNSAYRLRKSKCFLASKPGALSCTSCHNPHDVSHGRAAADHANGVCQSCHANATLAVQHPRDGDCVACHMPKRRTEDVVHAVMTDHRIQLPSLEHPLAELAERHGEQAVYRGEVVPYLSGEPLYTAVAQLVAKSNVAKGVPQLEDLLQKSPPSRPEPFLELGDAWRESDPEKAARAFQQALQRQPGSNSILRRLAQVTKDRAVIEQSIQNDANDAAAWYELGLIESGKGRKTEAMAAFERAAKLDPDLADAHNSLGAEEAEAGLADKAMLEFQAALRIDPFLADAHANYANLLASRGDLAQSAWQFEKAVRLAPEKAAYQFNAGILLARLGRYDQAQARIEAALKADPNLAEAHDLLGGLLERGGRNDAAMKEYREAVRLRPGFGKARVDLGTMLAYRQDRAGAEEQFRAALADADPAIRQQAQESLKALGAAR